MSDPLQLQDKRVLLTGAGSGIGRAAAISLAQFGARVCVTDLDGAAARNVAEDLGPSARFHAVDATDPVSVEQAFTDLDAAWGGVDAVVHAAGIMREQGADIRDIELESWELVLRVNLTGAFIVSQAAVRRFIPAGAGTLILVGSGAGVEGPSGSIPYGASKGGVNGLAMTLAHHLRPHGVRVHNFAPGAVDTPLYRNSLRERVSNGATPESVESFISGSITPEAVGYCLALLVSPLADALKGNISTR